MTYSYLDENTTYPSRLTSFDKYLDAGIEQNYKLAKIPFHFSWGIYW